MNKNRLKQRATVLVLSLALGLGFLSERRPRPIFHHTQTAIYDGYSGCTQTPFLPRPRVVRFQSEVPGEAELSTSERPSTHSRSANATVLSEFANWAQSFIDSNPLEKTSRTVIENGVRLAIARRSVLKALIESDPGRAFTYSTPDGVRNELPEVISQHLEKPVSGHGDFRVAIADDFERRASEVRREVSIAGSTYAAFVYGKRAHEGSRRNVRIEGIAIDQSLALLDISESEIPVAQSPARLNGPWAGDEGGGSGYGATAASSFTQGTKTLLFMPVGFSDDPAAPITQSAANLLMTQVNQWFTEQSYNSTSIVSDVTPLLILPQSKAFYAGQSVWALQDDARSAALAVGFDTANYELDIVCNQILGAPNFNFAGFGSVGGKGLVLQIPSLDVVTHELGHNYGLWHANFWSAAGDSVIGPGSTVEYGNSFDTMGARNSNPGLYAFNACFKNKLNWLPTTSVHTVATSGLYRINAFDVPNLIGGQKYAIRIQKDYSRSYWAEFRQKFTANPWSQNGIILNWSPWNNYAGNSLGGTTLLDTTPGTPSGNGGKDDSPLVIGRTFSDIAAGVHITPIAKGSAGSETWIDVQVNIGDFSSNVPPTLDIAADQSSVSANTDVHFTASAVDADGDALAYYWDFGDLTFGTNASTATKRWSTAGEYAVRCTVSDMKGGVASRNLTITIGTPGTFQVGGRVMDSSNQPIEGVRIDNGLSGSSYRGAYTDSDGYYTLAGLPTGSYSLRAAKYGFVLNRAGWSNPVNVGPSAVSQNWLAIANPSVRGIAADPAASEVAGNTGMFTLIRSGSLASPLTVRFDLSGNATYASDYSLTPSPTLSPTFQYTIPSGAASIDIVLTPLTDSAAEGSETVIWTILDDPAYTLASMAEASVTIADGQPTSLPAVTLSVTDDLAPESASDAGEFVFERVGSTAGSLTVHYQVSGTATNGVDYSTLSGTAIIPAGSSSILVPIAAIDDGDVEGDETITATISPDSGYIVGTSSNGTIKIADDDPIKVTITATDGTATENSSDAGIFTVMRVGSLVASLPVHYSLSGLASNGSDFASLPGTVIIPVGQSSVSFPVTPLNDNSVEGTETVIATLTSDPAYNIGHPGSATLLILDDDTPGVTLTASDNSAAEPGSNTGAFTFVRTGGTSEPLTVYYSVSGTARNGVDYATISGSIVIPSGAASTVLTITPLDDTIKESAETVVVTLQPSPIGTYSMTTTTPRTVTIADNDGAAQVGVGFVTATSSASESAFIIDVSVSLSAAASVPVFVTCSITGGTAVNGVDFGTDLPRNLYFPAGLVSQNVTIIAINDNETVQPNRTVVVSLGNPSNAQLDSIATHTFTILDDDGAGGTVTVTAIGGSASESGQGTGTFHISRSGGSTADLSVGFQVTGTASSPSDFAPIGNTVVIPAGQSFVDVLITPVDDSTPEPTESVTLTLTSASAASVGTPNAATVSITDNDVPPPVTVGFSAAASATSENISPAMVLVSLSSAKATPVTVHYAATGGTAMGGWVDYSLTPGTLTFAPGETVKAIPIAIIKDGISEASETVVVTLDTPTGAALGTSSFTLTIVDGSVVVWDANTSSAGAQDGAGVWDIANTKWIRNGANTPFVNGDLVAFGSGSGAAGTVTITGSNLLANGVVFNPAGSGSYIVAPSATEALGILNDGIIANESALLSLRPDIGASQTWTVTAGKTLTVGTATQFVGGLDAGETLVISGTGTVQSNGSKVLVNGGTSSTIQIETGATLEMNKGTTNNALFARNATDTADATINLTGTGTLRLKAVGANTYFAGSVFHSAFTGTIECAGDGRLGAQAGTKYRLHVNSGVNADLSSNVGSTVSIDGLTGAGTLLQNNATAGTVALAFGVNDTTSGGMAGTAQWDGAFSTTGANRIDITKVGTGTQIVNGIDDRTSGGSTTTVSAGTLLVTNAAAISGEEVAGRITVQAGATFTIRGGSAGEWTTDSLGSLVANAVFHAGARLGIDVSAGNSLAHTAAISGNQSLLKLGGGTLTLTEANTYTGDTVVAAGTLSLDAAGLANTADVNLTTTAALNLNFLGSDTIDELRFNGVPQMQGTWGSLTSSAQQKTAFITGTGILNVTGGSLPPFAAWAVANGLDNSPGKESAFDADPEKDGIPNGLEWILGGNPLADSASRTPQLGGDSTNLTLTFTRSDDSESNTTLVAQWSGTLGGWSDVPIGAGSSGPDANGVSVSVSENDTAPDTIMVTIPRSNGSSGAVFVRLKATAP